jgi:hypothetical protein
MSGKTKVFLLFLACLLTMCTSYANRTTYSNALACQDYTEYKFFEWTGDQYNFYSREAGTTCSYTCPDGTVKEVSLTEENPALVTASSEVLNTELCGEVAPSPTAMESLLTVFPVTTGTSTLAATRTARGSPTVTPTLGTPASATLVPAATIAAGGDYLNGTVSMCDLGGKLINFRIAQPPRDITGMTLQVTIEGRESMCYVNPTNRSLLTCTIPVGVSFPADIVVSLDGVVVNEFVYNGLGCALITTPTPAPRTPRPTIYP